MNWDHRKRVFLFLYVLLAAPAAKAVCQDEKESKNEKQQQIRSLWIGAQELVQKGDYAAADAEFSKVLKLSPEFSMAHYYRGRVRFQASKVADSVKDFDRHVELSPDLKSRQWERGIALYYVGKFKQGAEQFEIYQTYHDNDVENSAWRFLCVAKEKGIEAARKNLLPIRNDRRIPMMQIYEMYQGKKTPDDVLEAAEKLSTGDRQRNSALFYAHLYIGLLYEVQGKPDLSLKHIKLARKHRIEHYMWDVANVHCKHRESKKKKQN